MRRPLSASIASLAAIAAILLASAPASANICDQSTCINVDGVDYPVDLTVVFDSAPPLEVPLTPGMVQPETQGGRGGSSPARPGGAGSTSGDTTAIRTMINPEPLRRYPVRATLHALKGGLWKDVPFKEVVHSRVNQDGPNIRSVTFTVDPEVADSKDLVLRAIFWNTANDFSACSFVSDREVDCMLRKVFNAAQEPPGTRSSDRPWTLLVPPPAAGASDRLTPICSGSVVDAGIGVDSLISLEDAHCEASPETRPVALRVISMDVDPVSTTAVADSSTGGIRYSAHADREGYYTVLRVAAVTVMPDIESYPFTILVRNHFGPHAQGVPVVDTIRGVETVIPRAQLFSDLDLDVYSDLTEDHLTGEVLVDGSVGYARFDGSGNLHYRPIDAVEGSATDSVLVRVVDSFGTISEPLKLEIRVSDVTPSCSNGSVDVRAGETITLDLDCRLDGPAGYRPLKDIEYSIVSGPDAGALSTIDPASGIVEFTAPSDRLGPVTITFAGTNNGARREGQFTANIVPSI